MGPVITTKQVIEVNDWDAFVEETYGIPYSFQQQDGCKGRGSEHFSVPPADESMDFENDSIIEKVNGPEEGVSFKGWLARDPKAPLKDEENHQDYYLNLFYGRNFYPSFDVLVQDLYDRGLMEAGEYTIEIDW